MTWTDIKDIPLAILNNITIEQAWHYRIIPFDVEEQSIHFYTDNKDVMDTNELSFLLAKNIQLIEIEKDTLERALSVHYRKSEQKSTQLFTLKDSQNILEELVNEAGHLGTSDIHIEPYENRNRVRFRIDGLLVERFEISKEDFSAWINRIKIQANMDIAEKRLPQDGRILYKNEGKEIDIRVSVLPTLHGEKAVLRLLNNQSIQMDLQHLGMNEQGMKDYLDSVKKTQGIVIISGPTGSGKTTTLYATLKLLNKSTKNIITIEDPIEYTLEGINQVQLKENIGLNFPKAMKTFLRQDPDIIMVGEIRDKDTAQMAIRASLTGHLVLSTLHTNSAWGIVSRLTEMGTPAYLLAETLNAAVAQRMVRKLCNHCKEETAININEFPKHFIMPYSIEHMYQAVGCSHCHFTGYKGRTAIYEIIEIDRELAHHIKKETGQIQDLLKERNIATLSDNAFELLAKGMTSIDEIYPILASQ